MNLLAPFRRHATTETPAERIAEARAALGAAQLDLAYELQNACPGPHQYGQHADGEWCCYCGYDRDGKRIRTEPCAGAQTTSKEGA